MIDTEMLEYDESTMEEPEQQKRSIRAWIQYTAAIIISIAVCWYYLARIEWDVLLDSFQRANLTLALIGLILPNLAWWWADSRLNQLVIGWFHKPIELWGIFWVRGFTYLMAIVYPPLAEVGMLAYLYRKTQMTARLFAGIIFFKGINTGLGLLFLVTASSIAAYAMGLNLDHHVNATAWWAAIAFGYFGFFHAWSYWIRGHSWGPLNKYLNRKSEFFIPYARGTMKQWAITWAYMIFPMMLMYAGYYLVAQAFDVNVHPVLFVVLCPLVFTLARLPVFFGGFGGTTLFWDRFFPESGTDEAILALTLFIPVARLILNMIMGLVCLIPAQQDIALIWKNR